MRRKKLRASKFFGTEKVIYASIVFNRNKKRALERIENIIWHMRSENEGPIPYRKNKSDLIRAESLKKIISAKIPKK